MRLLKLCLAFTSACSIGFNLPAHAANQTPARKPANASDSEFDRARERFVQQLAQKQMDMVKIFDAKGAPTSIEKAMNDAKTFSEGIVVESGGVRIRLRGELLDDGKNGMLIMATQERDGRAVNGQVMTIKPGMSKLEIESRLHDLALSFSYDYATKGKDDSRKPAQDARYLPDCVLGLAGGLLIGGLLVGLAKGNRLGSRTFLALGGLIITACGLIITANGCYKVVNGKGD